MRRAPPLSLSATPATPPPLPLLHVSACSALSPYAVRWGGRGVNAQTGLSEALSPRYTRHRGMRTHVLPSPPLAPLRPLRLSPPPEVYGGRGAGGRTGGEAGAGTAKKHLFVGALDTPEHCLFPLPPLLLRLPLFCKGSHRAVHTPLCGCVRAPAAGPLALPDPVSPYPLSAGSDPPPSPFPPPQGSCGSSPQLCCSLRASAARRVCASGSCCWWRRARRPTSPPPCSATPPCSPTAATTPCSATTSPASTA